MAAKIITTDTLHHRYFCHQVLKHHPFEVYLDTRDQPSPRQPPFITREIDELEGMLWGPLPKYGLETDVESLESDLTLIYGAGILHDVERLGKTINCHGGRLPQYRGLDTNLWAKFNGDEMGVTLHAIDEGIDTGPIYSYRPLRGDITLINIRYRTTLLATEMVLSLLREWPVTPIRQEGEGAYYSTMPWDVKREVF